jgi:hypothetical protein
MMPKKEPPSRRRVRGMPSAFVPSRTARGDMRNNALTDGGESHRHEASRLMADRRVTSGTFANPMMNSLAGAAFA